MGDGSSGGATQQGAQKGITLAGSPSWAAGDRLMPQSMMQAMAVPTSIPSAPGTQVIAPPAPQTESQTPVASIPQSPLYSSMQGFNNEDIPLSNGSSIGSRPIIQNMSSPISAGEVTIDNPNFQQANAIQNLLPQVQSAQNGAPASNATPNTAQSPSQPNPVASPQASNQNQVPTSDQNLDQASKWVLNELEGSELTKEKNGRYSRFGIGSDPDEPLPENVDQAQQFVFKKYINQHPDRASYLSQLTDPKDQAAYLQGLILNPKPIDNFTQGYPGQIGGQEWRNAMLNTQSKFLYSLAQSNPQKYGGDLHGWLNRINKVRNWNPQQQGNT